ncbi:MAG TPA: hypothetical protein VFD82_11685 [Planctomycetota bacterium]|nr:hypothetical protein [Planctomycetota bacterium]
MFATTAATLSADELRLTDGRVLVGKVVEKGDTLEVTTRDGVVLVQKDQVKGRKSDEDLRVELAKRTRDSGDTAFAHLNLAMRAREVGLEREMWSHLDRTIELVAAAPAKTEPTQAVSSEPEATACPAARSPLQRRLEDFLAQLEPELLPRKWRTAPTKTRVHQLLDLLRADTGRGRERAIEELLVREQSADEDLRLEARTNSSDRRRIGALAALHRRPLAGNERFVLRTTILDGSSDVRKAAAEISVPTVDSDDINYLGAGLMHSNPKVRVRTAEAFGELGHPDAVKLLVLAGPNAGVALAAADNGVRAHVAFLQQQAYIRDYDVEVAQAAFIADPKVDVLQSGTVLDVTVHGVQEVRIVRTYQQALRKLVKQDPPADPRVWGGWLASLSPAGSAPTTSKR